MRTPHRAAHRTRCSQPVSQCHLGTGPRPWYCGHLFCCCIAARGGFSHTQRVRPEPRGSSSSKSPPLACLPPLSCTALHPTYPRQLRALSARDTRKWPHRKAKLRAYSGTYVEDSDPPRLCRDPRGPGLTLALTHHTAWPPGTDVRDTFV